MRLPLADHESTRLDVLRSFRILDTPPEQVFDDLTRLAAYICGTPIAFIGFMDADRLWFKSRVGWDVPEIPREMSFCAHTILQSDVLAVCDTLADQGRLATCPLATHGGIRFYAGVSLMSSEGCALGTLCAMDTIPRGLTSGQTDALRRLAHQVGSLIEMRRPGQRIPEADPIQRDDTFSSRGENVLGFSFWQDALEQKRTIEALRHSEQRFQGIIGSAMDAIITIDATQRIIVFNKAAEQIFRCRASDALGHPIEKFIPERFRQTHGQHIEAFGKTGVTSRSMCSPGTLFAIRADGQEFPIEATISQVDSAGEKLFTVILRDIGARLRMESELRQALKMEAVGQLAGGIAHEFNNDLGVILGYTELLSEEDIDREKLDRYVTEIKGATQHAASMTRQLLAFSRKQVPEPQILDVNQSIWDSHKLLRRLLPANIDLVPVLAPTVGHVKLDLGHLQQILINLVVNARDAMPQGGKVVIETADVELEGMYAGQLGLEPGHYVTLTISDTGAGMDAETRSHLFEPFYTTKEPGKGTGLGLSTVYGIVKHNGGQIAWESVEGRGTTFRIYLPQVQDAVTEAPPDSTPRPLDQPELRTVLVVEDETALRRLICHSLERKNYTVFAAKDGIEGLELFRQHASDIQLVITDLMMPRMDGFDLKEHILGLNPLVKFLFMSGYAEEIVQRHHRSLRGCAFLEKPFLPEELVNKVRNLLAGVDAA